MPDALRFLLTDLRTALQNHYGDRLVQLVLYGSHARGEAHQESDVDVMVVLQGSVDPVGEIRQISPLVLDTGLTHEKLITIYPISAADYKSRQTALLQSIYQEGVPL
ncbi:MAG: nucleotidyltransferase domain-containing protein [Acidiferrobacterales bacterium]|nr:nucleotidyltransferase domain-containing protein [Acidiferrobacterales bacterium]